MKKLVKVPTILLVTFFFFNNLNGANYTLNNTTWSPNAPNQSTLSNADSVIIRGSGVWSLTQAVTVACVRLSGGTLAQSNFTLTGAVSVKGLGTISGTGSISGDVNLAFGTLTVSNTKSATSWTLNGGTLSNSSNISGPVTVSNSANISGSGTLAALTVSNGTLTLGSNKTATSVLLSGGSLNVSTFTLSSPITANASGTLYSSTTGNIGALTVTGGTLTLVGRTQGTQLTLNGGDLSIGSSRYNITSGLTVRANATISGNTNGKVYFNGNNITLVINGGSLTIDGTEVVSDNTTFSSNHHIYTTNGGIYGINFTQQHPVIGAKTASHIIGTVKVYIRSLSYSTLGAFTIPIGNANYYAPLAIYPNTLNTSGVSLSNTTSDTFSHYYIINYFGFGNSNTNIDNTLTSASGSEYWNVTSSSTNPAATFTFFLNTTGANYGKTSVLNSTNVNADIQLSEFVSFSGNWTKVASTVGAVTGGVSVITNASIAPNNFFTFGSLDTRTSFLTPLPVSIINFSAKAIDAGIEVKWSTASEKDNSAFVLEKSLDGQTWAAIGTVKGAKTSNVVNNYGIVDYKAVAGFQYYRLKQIDLDGTVNYSKAIAVNFSKASTLNVNLFPNPAKDALNITTENNATGEVNIQILNSMGETVYKQVLEAGLVQSIDITSFIPGVYYVSVIAEGESKIIRLLKN